ncbi:hypothetical protein SH661x_003826 [Planctomicrobium sp. SH661]|uniref:hypothetical protein n=1 Tax=Planctomicrobium sp. SH661 TaxID=3448124 RepID=UPI003F5BA5EC
MNRPDSSPNFDWLKKNPQASSSQLEKKDPPFPALDGEASTAGKDLNASESIHDDVLSVDVLGLSPKEEGTETVDVAAVQGEINSVPAPILNDSDGTTVIMPNRKFLLSQGDSSFGPAENRPEEGAVNEGSDNGKSVEAGVELTQAASETTPAQSLSADVPSPTTPNFGSSPARAEYHTPPDFPVVESAVLEELSSSFATEEENEGHTEVLRAEDIDKARQSWPKFPIGPDASARTSPSGTGADALSVGQTYDQNPVATSVVPASPSRSFVILASYASAITIAFLALLMRQIYEHGHPHQLESLPDIATQKEGELTYVPANARLPAGHTLHFHEQQRFGNILVEPLSITREPVDFVHYSGDSTRTHPPTSPVWKLKLRLTNLSKDQVIAPLDRNLVLRWVSKAGQPVEFTNYFISPEGTTDRNAPTVQLYRLPVDSDWDLAGQELGKVLQPGESYETYLISAEEGFDALPEDLVWRVQIRKGYSEKGNGVTTIFQVAFKKDDVTGV